MQRQMMRQMQKKMGNLGGLGNLGKVQEKLQEELAAKVIEGTSGGGVVKIEMNGKQEVLSVKIDPSVVNPEEADVLEDLVMVAMKDALSKSQALGAEMMSSLTGGLNIPGLF
ncbi:MAG: YbaB/EbfC family nucleoid-associated protein [Candidatus Eremiobacteraeota bacterium]|nr:YbaB/EbfC family nucleoid-associated protein [Candidatus Eremiobacteraeota bacterium]